MKKTSEEGIELVDNSNKIDVNQSEEINESVENGQIVTINNTEIAKTSEEFIIFKATKPLTKEEFELLSYMVRNENEKTGLKIVLMPFSCELA